jgi:antitoxin component of MazEF toxin-antitoxin module
MIRQDITLTDCCFAFGVNAKCRHFSPNISQFFDNVVTSGGTVASVYKMGNSLAALIPSHAAKQLALGVGTPIHVLVFEDEIRIRNAKAPGTESSKAGRGKRPKLVAPVEEPW